MSLKHIHDRCKEMETLTAEGWPDTPQAQEEALARVKALQTEIRDVVRKHNSAVLKVVRSHHPDEPHVKPDELDDPVEHLQADWERIDLPSDVDCLNPLPLEVVETEHQNVPAFVAAMHRFAKMVGYQAGTRLLEADGIHRRNTHGERISRLPHRADDAHEPIGHA